MGMMFWLPGTSRFPNVRRLGSIFGKRLFSVVNLAQRVTGLFYLRSSNNYYVNRGCLFSGIEIQCIYALWHNTKIQSKMVVSLLKH